MLFVALLAFEGTLDWFSEGPPDGPYESYYENGQLWEKGTHKDGKRDGPWEEYWEDGELTEKGIYKDNEKCGKWIEVYRLHRPHYTYDPC